MKTAVEVLKQELDIEMKLGTKMVVDWDMYKEMEKENIINFAIQCMFSTKDIGSNLKNDFFIKKYNETFKSE